MSSSLPTKRRRPPSSSPSPASASPSTRAASLPYPDPPPAANAAAAAKPAELFRKDLISAMKLPDNEPLAPGEYFNVQDSWKQVR
jgi:hypothetical protein